MAALNKQMIIGHVGRDAECKYTQGGTAVANFSVAVSEKYGEKETTEWFDVTCWGKPAETAGTYVKKGMQIYVEGSQKTEKWTDKNTGQPRSKKILNARHLQFLGKKGDVPSSDTDDQWKREDERQKKEPIDAGYEIGDLGSPLEM